MKSGTLTGLAASSITLGEVTTLDHEVLDDTVESRALVAEALLASGQSAEVFGRLGHCLAVQSQNYATQVFVTMLDIEVDLVGDLGTLGRGGSAAEEQHAHADEQHGRDEEPPGVEHVEDGLVTCQLKLSGAGKSRKRKDFWMKKEEFVKGARRRETRFTKLELGNGTGGLATCMKLGRCNSPAMVGTPLGARSGGSTR